MKKELNATDTAKALGVCDKTLRLWVKSGKLQPVQGTGGQGRALAFNVAEVEVRRIRHAGVTDADFLARIAYAFQLKRETPTCRWLPWYESQMLWIWHKAGKNGGDKLRQLREGQVRLVRDNCFPPLAQVPQKLTTWASRLGRVLTPDELDYLAAMFVVVEYPWHNYNPLDEKWALMRSLEITGEHDRNHENILEDAYTSGDAGSLRSLIEDREDNHGNRHAGILNYLRIEGNRAPSSLLSAARKQALDHKEKGKGNPAGARVATLLCIHRYQATRISTRIMEKIGQNGMVELGEIFELSRPPRVWCGEYRYRQQRRRRFSWVKAIAPRSRPAVEVKPLVSEKPAALCLQCGAPARLVGSAIVCADCGWQMDVQELREIAAEKNNYRTYKKASRISSPGNYRHFIPDGLPRLRV